MFDRFLNTLLQTFSHDSVMLEKCYQSFIDLDALKTHLNNCKMAGRTEGFTMLTFFSRKNMTYDEFSFLYGNYKTLF